MRPTSKLQSLTLTSQAQDLRSVVAGLSTVHGELLTCACVDICFCRMDYVTTSN